MSKIQVTPELMIEAFKVVKAEREMVVNNISYAHQISGENTSQYEAHLKRVDETMHRMLSEMDRFCVCKT